MTKTRAAPHASALCSVLNDNLLATLDDGWLPPNIKQLSLSNNYFATLPSLANYGSLTSLAIDRNRLVRCAAGALPLNNSPADKIAGPAAQHLLSQLSGQSIERCHHAAGQLLSGVVRSSCVRCPLTLAAVAHRFLSIRATI